jgi:hypothetical protein
MIVIYSDIVTIYFMKTALRNSEPYCMLPLSLMTFK